VQYPEGLGRRLMLSWDEVIEMHRNGMDFAAHTVSHPTLTMVDLDIAKREILQSKADIESRLHSYVEFFAYPYGNANDQIARTVQESGFLGAVASDPAWIDQNSDPYRLGRILACEDFNIFKAIFFGFWPDLEKLIKHMSDSHASSDVQKPLLVHMIGAKSDG